MHLRARRAIGTVSLLALALVTACGGDNTTEDTSTTTTEPTSTSGATQTTLPQGTSTTAERPTDPTTLLVVGDWGSGTAPQGAVAGAMQRYAERGEVDAILTTGDNFYTDEADFLMEPYGWVEDEGLDWWLTWGNHDVESETRVELVNRTFQDPPRWTVIDWGGLDVIILDSTQVDSPEQVDFLATTLAEGDEPTIVVSHHPPHSCESHADTVATEETFVSVFDEDVFLVLSGHEHNYQRFEAGGVAYVVTGGGGAGLTEFSECIVEGPEMVAGEVLHHFLIMSQNGEGGLEIQAIDVNGNVFDEVVLELP